MKHSILKKSLLALLFSGLIFAPLAQKHRGHPGHMRMMNPAVTAQLNLSDAQQKQIQEKVFEKRKAKIEFRAQIQLKELEFEQIMSTYPVDKTKAQKLAGEIADLKAKHHQAMMNSLIDFSLLLTKEQHQKMIELKRQKKGKRGAMNQPGSCGRGDGSGFRRNK